MGQDCAWNISEEHEGYSKICFNLQHICLIILAGCDKYEMGAHGGELSHT